MTMTPAITDMVMINVWKFTVTTETSHRNVQHVTRRLMEIPNLRKNSKAEVEIAWISIRKLQHLDMCSKSHIPDSLTAWRIKHLIWDDVLQQSPQRASGRGHRLWGGRMVLTG